jgi:hypothetical protein
MEDVMEEVTVTQLVVIVMLALQSQTGTTGMDQPQQSGNRECGTQHGHGLSHGAYQHH